MWILAFGQGSPAHWWLKELISKFRTDTKQKWFHRFSLSLSTNVFFLLSSVAFMKYELCRHFEYNIKQFSWQVTSYKSRTNSCVRLLFFSVAGVIGVRFWHRIYCVLHCFNIRLCGTWFEWLWAWRCRN